MVRNFSPLVIRRAAVLGAGVMGVQIAAHLANADTEVLLYELPAGGDDPAGAAARAIEGLKTAKPSPLACLRRAEAIEPAAYDQHLERLSTCDLVIEAIAERLEWKQELLRTIAPHLSPHCILTTNTSGLSINALADSLAAALQARFCGTHFFNPPRYMHLVELIPGHRTEEGVLQELEPYLVTALGKGVIYAKDTPGFIANRIGVFSLLATIHHAAAHGIAPEVVDALTGTAIGRPKTATYRTADLVGLDVIARVVSTLHGQLGDDPWHGHFTLPAWMAALVADGALGGKTGGGIYRKEGRERLVMDPAQGSYRPVSGQASEDVLAMLRLPEASERFAALRTSLHPQARFLWDCHRDLFHYSAVQMEKIGESVRDLDLALRWGFGWQKGPFESWQAAGWQQVAGWVGEDIAAGKAMSQAPLPAWAVDKRRAGVYTRKGAYAPQKRSYRPRPALDVYRRQLFPDPLPGETMDAGRTLFETDAVRLWPCGDDVAVLSFKTKMHVIGEAVLDGTLEAIQIAERNARALVLWHRDEPFSAGADLHQLLSVLRTGNIGAIDAAVAKFQHTALALRYCAIPTVAATRGLVLGGGCELLLHCDHVVASLESYIGLVESGVGLLPAGGGCKEMALRAARKANGRDLFPIVQNFFRSIAMAEVAGSAEEAKEKGYLRPSDDVLLNPYELLYAARAKARAMADAAYRPPLRPRKIPVLGANGLANLRFLLVNMREGGFISSHDSEVAGRLAYVLCGGDLPSGATVDEDWFLRLERQAFVELLETPKTRKRIEHTLRTGKPLRN